MYIVHGVDRHAFLVQCVQDSCELSLCALHVGSINIIALEVPFKFCHFSFMFHITFTCVFISFYFFVVYTWFLTYLCFFFFFFLLSTWCGDYLYAAVIWCFFGKTKPGTHVLDNYGARTTIECHKLTLTLTIIMEN